MNDIIKTKFLLIFLENCSIVQNQITLIKRRVKEKGTNYSDFFGYDISLPDLDFVLGDLDIKEKFLEWYNLEVV